MKAGMTPAAAGLMAVVCGVLLGCSQQNADVGAKDGAASPLTGTWQLNETRGPIRSADVSAVTGGDAVSEILGGPTNGSDYAYLIHTRMPPGAHGPALHTLAVDDYYVVLSGQLTVQIGTDTFTVDKYQAAVIPANTPHAVWNAGSEAERHLQVISSADPLKDVSRDLASMLKSAEATPVANAAQYIRKPAVPTEAELKPGLNGATFAALATGSPIQVRIDSTLPGSGGPNTHVHRFQQVYFEIEGETTLVYGVDTHPLKTNDVAIIAPAVVHTNRNESGAMERHITLLLPEPATRPLDIEFEEKGAVDGPGASPVQAPAAP